MGHANNNNTNTNNNNNNTNNNRWEKLVLDGKWNIKTLRETAQFIFIILSIYCLVCEESSHGNTTKIHMRKYSEYFGRRSAS